MVRLEIFQRISKKFHYLVYQKKLQEVCERIHLQTSHSRVQTLAQRTVTLSQKCPCYSSVATRNDT